MTVDPDDLNERQRTVSRTDLKMLSDDDEAALEDAATVDSEIREQFDF